MSKPALTEYQIRVACEWWAARLARPTFNALRPEERGREESKPVVLAEAMAASMSEPVLDDEVLSRFKSELAERLRTDEHARWGIGVDYAPDRILAEAATAAGIKSSMTTFPWKSYMTFHDGKVEAYCGYGQPFERLYP